MNIILIPLLILMIFGLISLGVILTSLGNIKTRKVNHIDLIGWAIQFGLLLWIFLYQI